MVSLSFYRYSSFALFSLCNAVFCVVGVWNLTLAEHLGWRPLIDAYLIAIGAAGIIWMFPVIFLDQFVHNALISRVWLESVWLCLAWILNLAGAAAASAVLPPTMCTAPANVVLHGSCATTNALLAFSWIGALNLLAYFCILMISAIIHMKDDSTVWGAHTRTYPWYKLNEQLNSANPSPSRTMWPKPLPSAAPSIRLPSDFSERMVGNGALKSSAVRSSTMKSSTLRSSMFSSEKLSAIPTGFRPSKTPLTGNKSARILQSAWVSAKVTPASPHSDGSSYSTGSGSHSGSGSSRSDLTSTPTGIPPSAAYVPFSSTIRPSPGVPPRSSSLTTSFNQPPPMSALLTPSRKVNTRSSVMPSPRPPAAPAGPRENSTRKSKRKSNRPPPLDMTRLHSTYGFLR
ncbi:hypothetical protein V8D89_013035 [Ganoderma adspersum]